MKNKVFLNKHGIIEIKVVGDQTVDSVSAMGEKVIHLVEERHSAKKPVLILDDLMQMGDVPPDARQRVVELGKSIEYDRLVMVGSNSILRLGANLMVRAVGKANQIRYFEDYDAATSWLLERMR